MKEFPTTADVAVIGGGVLGLSVAAWIARAKKRVVVCERGAIGCGSSGRSGAIVRAFYRHPLLARWAETCRRDLWTHFDELFERGKDEPPVFRRTGLVLYGAAAEKDALAAHFAEAGVNVQPVAREDLAGRYDYLAPPDDDQVVWHEVEAGYAEPPLVLAALVRYVRAHGGHFLEDCPIHTAKAVEGGSWRLTTPRGPLSAGALVVAAGPWAARVARELAGVQDLRVRPRKVQVLLLQRPAEGGGAIEPAVLADSKLDFYHRPVAGGVSLVGFLSPFDQSDLADADDFDESVRTDLARILRTRFSARCPASVRSTVFGHRPAMYAVTPDENFILGPGPVPNLYFATGGSGHAFKFAPLIGREVASMILGELAPFGGDPAFRWDRDFGGPRAFF